MITERDLGVLRAVAHYRIVSRTHVQRLCFPNDKTGRATRRRLQTLVRAGFIRRCRTPLFNPAGGSPWPVYYPTQRGLEVLAEHFDDSGFLGVSTRSPEPLYLMHWLAVTDTHIALDQAIGRQNTVQLEGWVSEWDTVNPEETQPERQYRLYTLLRDRPRLVCVPDAAFLLAVGEHRKVFYLEQDRATTGVRQVAARKTPGYAELFKRNGQIRHFPQATVPGFTVLLIAPTARRRDGLRKAIKDKPGADLWKFAAQPDLTPEAFLHEPVFFPCEGDPVPLTKTSAATPSQTKQPTQTQT